jgi:hypothetical protein
MRRVFAITIALMFVAFVLSPTMGYSVQSGNHSYSFKSARVNYTIGIEAPSHQPAVVVTREPNSLKYGALFQPEAKGVGETAKSNVIGLSTPSDVAIQARTNTPAVPRAEPKFSIRGMVYSDQNGNGKMDYNETSLANWVVNLEQPAGNVVSKAVTDKNGGYGFFGLTPGEYAVAEVLEMGWSLTAPPNGKYAINLTNNATMLSFGNEILPPSIQNATTPSNATSSSNVTLAENASLSRVT